MDKLDIETDCPICCREHVGKNEPILVDKEAAERDGENLMKDLRTIMDSSDNLRKVICDSYQVLKTFEACN